MQAPVDRSIIKLPPVLTQVGKPPQHYKKYYDFSGFVQLVTESATGFLPAVSIGEEENQKVDLKRMEFILKLMNYLSRINFNPKKPRSYSDEEWEGVKDMIYLIPQYLIYEFGMHIFNLSKSLRSTYDGYFQPQPFSWHTLEQFGGMAKDYRRNAFVSKRYGAAVGSTLGRDSITNELVHRAKLVGKSLPRIIKEDFPRLNLFFTKILMQLKNNHGTEQPKAELPVIELPAIKAIVTHLRDTGTLHELLQLINNTDSEVPVRAITRTAIGLDFEPYDAKKFAELRYNFTTKTGKFAALRRLQLIDELLKGINCSKQITSLFPEVDWEAFLIIRNASVHQDQGCNRQKILYLLNEPKFLKLIYDNDFHELAAKLESILEVRAKSMGPLNPQNLSEYAEKIYDNSQRFYEQLAKKHHDMMQGDSSLPVKEDKYQLFMMFITMYNKVLAGTGIEAEKQQFIELYCKCYPEILQSNNRADIDASITTALSACKRSVGDQLAAKNRISEELLSKLSKIFTGKVTHFQDYSYEERGLVSRPLASKFWTVNKEVSGQICKNLCSIHDQTLKYYIKLAKNQSDAFQKRVKEERVEKRGIINVRLMAAYLDGEYAEQNNLLEHDARIIADNNPIYEPIDDMGQFQAMKELFNDLMGCLKEMDIDLIQIANEALNFKNIEALNKKLTNSLLYRYALEYLVGQLGLHCEALRESGIITPDVVGPMASFRFRFHRNQVEHGYASSQRFEFHPKEDREYVPESKKIQTIASLTCNFMTIILPKLPQIKKNLNNKLEQEKARQNARDRMMIWSSLLGGASQLAEDRAEPDEATAHLIVPKSN